MASEQELYAQYLKEMGGEKSSQANDPLYAQYLKETGQEGATTEPDPFATLEDPQQRVLNEVHPELSGLKGLKVRTVYKAFGTDPKASMNYLQKEYPGLEWKRDAAGDALVKAPGDEQWRRLDPSGFDARDVADLAWDIPAGVAQGVATTASGLAGAAATIPAMGAGAIPAAMAGSAASGTALEAARQGIGKYFMPDQEFDTGALKFAAGAGAVSPLLFGTGATMGQVLKSGMSKDAAKSFLQTQRGAVGRGWDAAAGKVGPWLGELASGEKSGVIKKAASMLPQLKAADTNPEVVSSGLKTASEGVAKGLKDATQKAGAVMNEARDAIDNFDLPEAGIPGLVVQGNGVSTQMGAQQAAGQTARKGSIPTASFIEPFREMITKLSDGSTRTAGQMKDLEGLNKVLESEFKDLPENITAAQAQVLQDRFKTLAKSYGMNYGKAGSTVSATGGAASAVDAQLASAFEASRRNVKQAVIDRLEQINPDLRTKYDDASETYGYLKDLGEANRTKFKDAKATRDTFLRATKDDLEAQNLLDLQEATGVNLTEVAKEQAAYRTFSKPSFDIRSLGGTTSTSRTLPLAIAGGTAGYYGGQQSGGEYSPFLMGALGTMAGSKLASPAMMRNYMQMNQSVRNIPNAMGSSYQAMPYTLMNTMKEKK